MNEFGRRLKRVQGALGLSQAMIADELGLHINSIRNYQAGKTAPDADMLARMCRIFRVSPAWLLLGEGEMLEDWRNDVDDAEREAIFLGYQGLTNNRRRKLRGVLTMLLLTQARDGTDKLLEGIKNEGANSGILGRIANATRKVDELEWDVVKAFLLAMKTDERKIPEPDQVILNGAKGRNKHLPPSGESLRNDPNLIQDVTIETIKLIPEECASALRKFELGWEDLLGLLEV